MYKCNGLDVKLNRTFSMQKFQISSQMLALDVRTQVILTYFNIVTFKSQNKLSANCPNSSKILDHRPRRNAVY